MNSPRWAWILFVALAVGAPIFVVRADREAAAHAARLAIERRRSAELQRLQEEHLRLVAEQTPGAELKKLEFRRAQLEGLSARLAALQANEAAAETSNAPDEGDALETVPAGEWIYAGRATPRAALESVLWAASHGDIEHLAELLGFTDEARTKADAIYSQLPEASKQEYASPERVVATLLAGSFPKSATAMTIVGDETGEQEADVSMRVDHSSGGPRTNTFSLRRMEDGWQLLVPASVITGFERSLMGDVRQTAADTP
jgi:hypothetical protein